MCYNIFLLNASKNRFDYLSHLKFTLKITIVIATSVMKSEFRIKIVRASVQRDTCITMVGHRMHRLSR